MLVPNRRDARGTTLTNESPLPAMVLPRPDHHTRRGTTQPIALAMLLPTYGRASRRSAFTAGCPTDKPCSLMLPPAGRRLPAGPDKSGRCQRVAPSVQTVRPAVLGEGARGGGQTVYMQDTSNIGLVAHQVPEISIVAIGIAGRMTVYKN